MGWIMLRDLPSCLERRLDEIDQAVAEEPGNGEAREEVEGGVDDAAAQLVQVLHQAHAGRSARLVTASRALRLRLRDQPWYSRVEGSVRPAAGWAGGPRRALASASSYCLPFFA